MPTFLSAINVSQEYYIKFFKLFCLVKTLNRVSENCNPNFYVFIYIPSVSGSWFTPRTSKT